MSVDFSRGFSSLTPGDCSSMFRTPESLSEAEEGKEDEEEEDLVIDLESLMVRFLHIPPVQLSTQSVASFSQDDLGLKEAQREAMRQLPDDRKRFLILQHRQSQPQAPEPLRATKTGPSDEGLFSNVKRFSLATVGWGPTVEDDTPTPLPSRPATAFGSAFSFQASSTTSSGPVSPTMEIVQAQPTGSSTSWSSWWSTASNATGTGQTGGERAKDIPQFYVDQMSST